MAIRRSRQAAIVAAVVSLALTALVGCDSGATGSVRPTENASPVGMPSSPVEPSLATTPTPTPTSTPTPVPTPSGTPKPSKVTVTAGPKLASGRSAYAATKLADGRILLIGGYVSGESTPCHAMACVIPPTATAEIYDPRTRSFKPTGTMNHPRLRPQSVLLHDGRVFVMDGEQDPVRTAEVYDPATGRFRDLGAMHQDTSGDAVFSLPIEPASAWRTQVLDRQTIAVLVDGRVLIAGGMDDLGDSSNAVTVFDPTTNTFANLPGMPVPWQEAAASVLTDGRVLFTGGVDSSTNRATDEALIFNPATNAFTATGSTAQDRGGGTQTVLGDGRVFVGGGANDLEGPFDSPQLSPEIYDPSTASFSMVAWTNAAPNETPVLVPDGRVLLLGGMASDGSSVRDVYAYDPDSGTVSLLASSALPEGSVDSAFDLDDGSVLILYSPIRTVPGVYILTLGG